MISGPNQFESVVKVVIFTFSLLLFPFFFELFVNQSRICAAINHTIGRGIGLYDRPRPLLLAPLCEMHVSPVTSEARAQKRILRHVKRQCPKSPPKRRGVRVHVHGCDNK